MKEFERKNVTADSLGNVIIIKPNSNHDKLINDFLFPRMSVKEENSTNATSSMNKLRGSALNITRNLEVIKKEEKSGIEKKDDIKKTGIVSTSVNIKNINDTKNSVIFIENKIEEEKSNKYIAPKENKVIIQPAGSNFE